MPIQQAEIRGLRTAVLYARVSSQEQAKEGFSIPAQERLPANMRRRTGLGLPLSLQMSKQPSELGERASLQWLPIYARTPDAAFSWSKRPIGCTAI